MAGIRHVRQQHSDRMQRRKPTQYRGIWRTDPIDRHIERLRLARELHIFERRVTIHLPRLADIRQRIAGSLSFTVNAMGTINNINYLTKVMQFPCASPGPVIMIVTALEAAAPVLLELATFSCRDIIKTQGGVSWRCGRALKAIIRKGRGAAFTDGFAAIYKFGAPFERANWYFFLAEVGTDFLAKWTSLVYKGQGCIPSSGDVTVNSSVPFPTRQSPMVPGHIDYVVTDNVQWNFYRTANGFTVPPGYYWQTFFTIQTVPIYPAVGAGMSMWLDVGFGEGFEYPKADFTQGIFTKRTRGRYGASGRAKPEGLGQRVIWRYETNDDQRVVSGSMMTSISQFPILGQEPIGAGCFGNEFSPLTGFLDV